MDPAETELLKGEIADRIGKERMNVMIAEKIKSSAGLLTEAAAVMVLAKEMDITPKERHVSLSEISDGMKNLALTAKITRTYPVTEFRRGARTGRVCRVLLDDGSAQVPLVLWDDLAVLLEKGELARGSAVSIKNAYVKGMELYVKYSSDITVKSRKPPVKFASLPADGRVDISGEVKGVYGPHTYARNGETKTMMSLVISDGASELRVVFWEKVDVAKSASPGDTIIIENGFMRNGELNINQPAGVSLVRRPRPVSQISSGYSGEIEGEITSIECKDDSISVTLEDGKKLTLMLEKEMALSLLGVSSLAPDIGLETVCKLKVPGLLGKRALARGMASMEGGELAFRVDGIKLKNG